MAELTLEEALEIKAATVEAMSQIEDISRKLDHVRDEFALQSGTGNPDDGRMSDEDHEKLIQRVGAMKDEHVVALYLMSTDWLHSRLNGADHFLMTSIKTGFVEMAARWIPPEVFAEAWKIAYEDGEFDIDYLDET